LSERIYTPRDIEQLLLLKSQCDIISLNSIVVDRSDGQNTESELGDYIPDPNPTPEEETVMTQRRETIERYLNRCLSAREYLVVAKRFGLDDDRSKTLEEIGDELGLSRERVRQIEARALRKLRNMFMKNNITWENI
jgi:RNA polymerase primary sigma factor